METISLALHETPKPIALPSTKIRLHQLPFHQSSNAMISTVNLTRQ